MQRLIAVFVVYAFLLVSCSDSKESVNQSTSDDAKMIDFARQAVIDANEVAYDFTVRKPILDKSDPELIRITFVYKVNDKPGGDPVVYLSKESGALDRIEYTR